MRQSNQAGIESMQHVATPSDGGVRQSNQAGIERMQDTTKARFLEGANRTKLGLKGRSRTASLMRSSAPIEPSWD